MTVGIVAGLLLLVLGALAVAMSDFGNEKIRGFALDAVNAQIYGELSAEKLSFKGGHLVLQNVELKDPDGEHVASVQKVEVTLQLSALLRKTLQIQSVAIEKPELYVVQEDGTTNLQRALQPRHPKPEEPKQEKSGGPSLLLGKLTVRDGALEFEQRAPEGVTSYHVTDLSADGTAEVLNGGDGALTANLELGGLFAEPLEGPWSVKVNATGQGDARDIHVDVLAPGTELAALIKTLNENDADVLLEKLVVAPSTLRAFAPTSPLIATISSEGELHKRGTAVTARLGANAGATKLSLDAAADTAAKEVSKLVLELSDADLSELVQGGPKSDVALSLKANGGGESADDLHGSVSLTAPKSTMGGQPFGPIDIEATIDDGTALLEKFDAVLPGVRMSASGTVGRERVDVGASLSATDLGAFSRTVGTLAGPGKIDLGGSGTLKLSAHGATKNPALRVDAAFPLLRFQKNRLRGLSARASLPSARDLLTLDANVHAELLDMPATSFSDLSFEMKTQARQLTLEARARGLTMLSLTVEALLDSDRKGMDLRRLTLSYPEATWSLKAPSRLRFDGRELSVRKLELESGDQGLLLDGKKRGQDIDGRLSLHRFNLAKLPMLVVDPTMNLGGTLNAEVEASGTSRYPELKAHVSLRDGSYRELKELGVQLDGLYRRDRVTGNASATGVGTKLNAEFDVPVMALKQRKPQPIRINATVEELDLDRLAASKIKVPVKGFIAGSLEVKGLASDPKLAMEVTARDLVYEQLPPTSGKAVLKGAEDGRLFARLDVQMLEKTGFAELKAPWSLGRLIAKPPTKGELMRAPFSLRADFKEFPLPIPYTADITEQLVTGTLTIDADVKGSLLRPDGKLKARLAGISRGRSPIVEAGIDAVAKADEIRVAVDAVRQKDNHRFIDLVAVLKAGPAKLTNPDALERLPVQLKGTVGPVGVGELQSLLMPPRRSGTSIGIRTEQAPLSGTLKADVEGSGTLGDPKIVLRMHSEDLSSPGVAPGDLTISYDYEDTKHDLAVLMKGPTGGELKFTANSKLDVSIRGMRQEQDFTAIPIAAALSAHDFDPQFLSGVVAKIGRLGGRIDANATVKGTPTQPNVDGKFEWKDGLIAVSGSGRFEQIHLLAEGNNKRLEIKELAAHSGDGEMKLYLLAEDVGDRFTLKAKLDAKEFPIVSLDQLVATVSTRASMDGVATRTLLNVERMQIDEAHILLPEVKRKNLQQLDMPKDVVFTKRGKLVIDTAEEKKKREAEAAGTGGSGGSGERADFVIRARVFAPRNIWVTGKDINAEVGFADGFKVEIDGKPQLFGEVSVHRGRFSVFGRKFDLEPGSKLTFSGPPINPRLAVTALHQNEREQVKVNLAVSGLANKLEIKPTSDPPLTETEIYTLIATGRRSLHAGESGASSASTGAVSVVGSFAAGQLRKTLSNKLPLDVLSIEAGAEGLEGTKIEAGTYLNDRTYLGVTGRVGANPLRGENSNAVRLEYQLSRRWSFQAEYGDSRVGGADLIWSKEY